MPYKITAKTPRREIRAQGHVVTVPAPFAEGHVLTEAEANALNQVFAENLRNNVSAPIKAAAEEGSPMDTAAVQALFDEKATSYEFGIRQAATPLDPVEKTAQSIARQKVNAALRGKNISVKDLPEGKHAELIAATLEKYPEIRAEAERQVEASRNIQADELDLDI